MASLLHKLRFNNHLSIRWKLVIPFVGITVLVLFVLLPTTNRLVAQGIQDEADRRLTETATSVSALIQNSEEQAQLSAGFVANLPEIVLANNNETTLNTILPRRREHLGLQELSYYAADFQPGDPALAYSGPVAARRFQTSEHTNSVREELIQDVLSREETTSRIAIAPQSSQIIGAAPVHDNLTGEIRGVILAVFSIDEAFATKISNILDTNIALVKDNAIIATTIDPATGYERLIYEGAIDPDGAVNAQNVIFGNGVQHRIMAFHLLIDGRRQGMVLVTQPINSLAQVREDVQLVLLLFATAVIIVSLIIAAGVWVTFSQPLARLVEATNQVTAGNLQQRVEVAHFLFKDEITGLSENFNNMTNHLQQLYGSLEQRVADRTRELVEERNKLDEAMVELAAARDVAVAANQAKSEFVSLVSHELKVPMTSIKGYSELIASGMAGPINEQQADFLKTVSANVARMATLVSDLTDVSRIESGHLRIEQTAVSIKDVLTDVVNATKGQIEEKNQTLILEIPDDLPPIWADRVRLEQIMTNLISNAYKYTPDEGEIVICANQKSDGENSQVRINFIQLAVQDTGIGISPEDQEGIFQKFFRAGDEQARQAPGTGLGLNITKNLVEMQGGRIWFESTFRQGTTFYCLFPIAVNSPAETAPDA